MAKQWEGLGGGGRASRQHGNPPAYAPGPILFWRKKSHHNNIVIWCALSIKNQMLYATRRTHQF